MKHMIKNGIFISWYHINYIKILIIKKDIKMINEIACFREMQRDLNNFRTI